MSECEKQPACVHPFSLYEGSKIYQNHVTHTSVFTYLC